MWKDARFHKGAAADDDSSYSILRALGSKREVLEVKWDFGATSYFNKLGAPIMRPKWVRIKE